MSNIQYKKGLRVRIYCKYGGHCAYCGCFLDLKNFHIDHIIPLMRGMGDNVKRGSGAIENLNPSCPSCNIDKGTLDLMSWRYKLWEKIELLNKYIPNYRICKRFGFISENKPDLTFYFERIGD